MQWFFTAPSESIRVRRGDTLGLRAAANEFGDLLAPGLSNRTQDARWISLLAYALVRADAGMRLYGADTRQRYEWIRPLELLWIARSLGLLGTGDGRQLPGQRAVRRWLDLELSRRDDAIGLSPAQARQYRFNGVYGAYRVLLREIVGLTKDGDGWHPGPLAAGIERHVARTLGAEPLRAPGKARPFASPARFWRLRGWPTWERSRGSHLLPTERQRHAPLLEWERESLVAPLFGNITARAIRRRRTVEALASSQSAEHLAMVHEVSRVLSPEEPALGLLPAFSRMADAGVVAMNRLWHGIADARDVAAVPIRRALDVDGVTPALQELAVAARSWRTARTAVEAPRLRNLQAADLLAARIAACQGEARRLLEALLAHHATAGGGIRWFRADGDSIVRTARLQPGAGAHYRFRFWQIARLGVQVGAIRAVPAALRQGHLDEVSGESEDES